MMTPQNKNFDSYTDNQKTVLDLEKKYFDILHQIFSQKSFNDELKEIMKNINQDWRTIHKVWDKENVVDLAVERHINFRVYNDPLLKDRIKSIYPSVISSDTAFVTDDAVISIDSKTISVGGNFNDWKYQTVGCNQFSFDNKLNFYAKNKKTNVPITSLLEPYYKSKPVLSFFLSTLYFIDKENESDSWYVDSDYINKPYYSSKVKDKTRIKDEIFTKNIKFACMPHREVSNLFDYKIVDGVKSYKPADVPKPTGTSSVRVKHESLTNRYDSNGNFWKGFESWTI